MNLKPLKKNLPYYAKLTGIDYGWLYHRFKRLKRFKLPLTEEEIVILKEEYKEKQVRTRKMKEQADTDIVVDNNEELKDK